MNPTIAEHIRDTKTSLSEIEEDMKCLLRMEKEEKNMGEGFDEGALMGMLANKGVDPAVVAMLNDRRDRGDWGDGGFLALFLLLILCGGGNGFGWGNRGQEGFAAAGLERSINAASDYGMLMDTLNSNGTKQEIALQNLAQSMNCSTGQIQSALAGIDKQLALSQGSITGAIQACCCNIRQEVAQSQNAIQSQMGTGFCGVERAIERQGCGINSNIQESRYNTASQFAAQTALLQSQHCETLNAIQSGFTDLRLENMAEQNARLREQLARQSQEAQTALILNAIANKDTLTGTYNATAATFSGSLS